MLPQFSAISKRCCYNPTTNRISIVSRMLAWRPSFEIKCHDFFRIFAGMKL